MKKASSCEDAFEVRFNSCDYFFRRRRKKRVPPATSSKMMEEGSGIAETETSLMLKFRSVTKSPLSFRPKAIKPFAALL
jgi:hypothetical protein